jgi:hypothetical protein
MDNLANSSSDEEDMVNRPRKDKVYLMTKELVEKMTLLNHLILQDEDQMEITLRYIDLANSMMRNSAKRREEMEDKEHERAKKTYKRDIKTFPLGIRTLNLQAPLMVQYELSRICNYSATCPQSEQT